MAVSHKFPGHLAMFDFFSEKLFIGSHRVYRNLPNDRREVYLTFDDGPDVDFTPEVLKVLKDCGVQGTFFMIAEKAKAQTVLVKEIIFQGHRLGNHSADHNYGALFLKGEDLKVWVKKSESILQQLSGRPTVGFRSPNGVITPPLMAVLSELNQPMVLWNCRFFDTLIPWREAAALRGLQKLKSGDIILLHDRQRVSFRSQFLRTLKKFILSGQEQGWKFVVLPDVIK